VLLTDIKITILVFAVEIGLMMNILRTLWLLSDGDMIEI